VTHVRHLARAAALQALYLCEIGRTNPADALEAYFGEHGEALDDEARAFTRELVIGAVADQPEIDRLIGEHARNWRLERLAVVDRIVLRLAIWELRHRPDTSAAIVIDEALELARTFSGEEAVKFVNGVLDAVRKTIEQPDG
jgi:N utilization substance protein B